MSPAVCMGTGKGTASTRARPHPHLEVNVVLRKLLAGVREALGIRFVGPYLTGSLAAGDFDRDSDVDFVVVTDSGVDAEAFVRLDATHQRIATLDSWCRQPTGRHPCLT